MIKNDKTFDDVYFNGLKEMFETCKWLIKQKDLSKRLKGFKEDKTKSPQESDFFIGKVWEVKLNKEKLVLELNKMRVRMTRIYVELGNPNDCYADMRLRDEIEIFKKKVL